MLKDTRGEGERQERSRALEQELVKMVWPVLVDLKQQVDRRLVKTLLGLVMVLVMHRHRNHGLVLSELGGYLLDAEQGPAGTKRISKLVHSERWEARSIEDFHWQQADRRVKEVSTVLP